MDIREKQIEDILVSSPKLMQKTFGLNQEPKLIGRQIIVPSGRLDLLYTHKQSLLLIELKVVPFQKRFIKQVLDYKKDLIGFQKVGRLKSGPIYPCLLMPIATNNHRKEIEENGAFLQEYNPEEILKYFFSEKLRPISGFSELKPIDVGIWNIHLINKFIYHLKAIESIKALLGVVGGSSKTLYNKIRFANELGLVNWAKSDDHISLTELGKKYTEINDLCMDDVLSEKQAKLIREYVMQNPYASNVCLGIATIIECIFSLSRESYPIAAKDVEIYFPVYSGKSHEWQTQRAKMYGAKMYSNYAIELGLIGKTADSIYLTPEGFKFVIQMQLQKSIKMLTYLNVN